MNMRELMLLGIGLVALLGGAACGGASDGIVDSASEVTGGGAVGGAAQAVAEAVGDQTVAKPHVHPAEPAEAGEAGALAVVEPALANSLRRRVASQCALRLEEDFAALYQLVAPADRERIDLRGFLEVYGGGVLVVEELLPLEIEVDPSGEFADVLMRTVGRLELERLPERYRQTLRTPDPEALVRELEHRVRWEQVDGEWYFRLDEAGDHRH
jgi:hypothetical protein